MDNLVTQAANGDLDAMTSLLECYGPEIRQGLHIERRWQSQLEPDDVMQVTYLEAFLEIRRVRSLHGQSFSAWLQRIAANNLRDAIRGLRRRKHPQPERRLEPTSNADSCNALWKLLGATSSTPSRMVSRRETHTRIQESLERLPPDYREVVQLYDLENRPISEVAETLSRSQGAVHMLRARAHDRLRELLGGAAAYFSESP
jgi:RNA polymerase sigma-70 factor (ECF subfamily)